MGLLAERAMFEATDGVNTHKGMIFSMGIVACATGYYYQSHNKFSALEVMELSKKITSKHVKKQLEDMKNKKPKTHGELLYHRYHNPGIRGEVIEGFPTIRDIAYPVMKGYKGKNENLKKLHVLLHIMSQLNDTCVLSRSNEEELEWVKCTSRDILNKGSCHTERGLKCITKMNEQCIQKNISPGGAADLLAVTIFLCQMETFEGGRITWR